MTLEKEIRPDFVIYDQKGNIIILEHFGFGGDQYNLKKDNKEREYKKLCSQLQDFFFVTTDEQQIDFIKVPPRHLLISHCLQIE
jgi:hypothetical protein